MNAAPTVLIDAALRGAVIVLLIQLAGLVLRGRPGLLAARLGAALAAGLVLQVLASTPAFEARVSPLWQAPLVGVSVGNAVLFWLLIAALFDEEFRLRPWHLALWLAAAVLSAVNCALGAQQTPLWSIAIQRWLPVAGCGAAIASALAARGRDLVEGRRRLALFTAVAGTAYVLPMVFLRLTAERCGLSEGGALVDMGLLLLVASLLFWRLSRLGPNDFMLLPATAPAEPPAAPPPPDPAERSLAEALQQRVRDEGHYLEEDLSIASLAARLPLPEYRLRRLINQQLGYRNFNAFINRFRLDAARAALADPARREQAVLAIALEAGFQSIGPFNRAFKADTGLTPSEFRRQALADS